MAYREVRDERDRLSNVLANFESATGMRLVEYNSYYYTKAVADGFDILKYVYFKDMATRPYSETKTYVLIRKKEYTALEWNIITELKDKVSELEAEIVRLKSVEYLPI